MLKIRRPLGRLIFNMGIAIPGKTVFLIETAPWRGEPWIWAPLFRHRWEQYFSITIPLSLEAFKTALKYHTSKRRQPNHVSWVFENVSDKIAQCLEHRIHNAKVGPHNPLPTYRFQVNPSWCMLTASRECGLLCFMESVWLSVHPISWLSVQTG